jgi:glycolate oxidase FAD binding subunit
MQATGIGWLSLDAAPENLHAVLSDLRFELEHSGGSLVHCHYPPEMSHLDAWGQPGDALPLMRAVKNQFDPKNTLNPGRFLAGI